MTSEVDVVPPVLRVLIESETGMLLTGEVRERVREIVPLSVDDLARLRNRPDQRIDQTIRNLKSHRRVPGNPFHDGLLRDVPRGYAITDLGRAIVSRHDGR